MCRARAASPRSSARQSSPGRFGFRRTRRGIAPFHGQDRPRPALEVAALFGCAVITGVGAVVNTSRVTPGSTVAVIGLGGVGLNALLGAKLAGARQIVAIDLLDEKLALAKDLGASDVFNANDADCSDRVRAATGGGVDYAFEMAGSLAALEMAWVVTRRGGETVTAGLPHPDKRLAVPPVTLVAEERTLRGSYLGSCVPVRDIPHFTDLYRAGKLPVDRLMSDTIGFDGLNAAFDRLAAGETVRNHPQALIARLFLGACQGFAGGVKGKCDTAMAALVIGDGLQTPRGRASHRPAASHHRAAWPPMNAPPLRVRRCPCRLPERRVRQPTPGTGYSREPRSRCR